MEVLIIAQALTSLILVGLILLQQRGTALGSIFGGEGGSFTIRRGIEKKIFWATIVFGFFFLAFSVLNLAF